MHLMSGSNTCSRSGAGHRGGERYDESSSGGRGTKRCVPVGQEGKQTLTCRFFILKK